MTDHEHAAEILLTKLKENDRRLASFMRAAQDGDATVYARLLEEVAQILRRAIRSRNPYLQPGDIEDRVQDVLLSVHEARATYDPDRPFMPWLMAIVRNRMADEARRYARRSKREVIVDEVPETFSGNEANTNADDLANSIALGAAIEQLPPAQRKAIEMLKLRELSLLEASAESGASVASLKVTVHRAIKTLRKIMMKDT